MNEVQTNLPRQIDRSKEIEAMANIESGTAIFSVRS